MAHEALEVSELLAGWRKSIGTYRSAADRDPRSVAPTIGTATRKLSHLVPPLRDWIGYSAEAENNARSIMTVLRRPDVVLTEEQETQLEAVLTQIEGLIDLLNPLGGAAQFVKAFMDYSNRIDTRWTVGRVPVRMLEIEPTSFPFSPEGDLPFAVIYTNDCELRARGMSFVIDEMGHGSPVLNRPRVDDSDLADLSRHSISLLGGSSAQDSGSIRLMNPQFKGFSSDSHGRSAGLVAQAVLADLVRGVPEIVYPLDTLEIYPGQPIELGHVPESFSRKTPLPLEGCGLEIAQLVIRKQQGEGMPRFTMSGALRPLDRPYPLLPFETSQMLPAQTLHFDGSLDGPRDLRIAKIRGTLSETGVLGSLDFQISDDTSGARLQLPRGLNCRFTGRGLMAQGVLGLFDLEPTWSTVRVVDGQWITLVPEGVLDICGRNVADQSLLFLTAAMEEPRFSTVFSTDLSIKGRKIDGVVALEVSSDNSAPLLARIRVAAATIEASLSGLGQVTREWLDGQLASAEGVLSNRRAQFAETLRRAFPDSGAAWDPEKEELSIEGTGDRNHAWASKLVDLLDRLKEWSLGHESSDGLEPEPEDRRTYSSSSVHVGCHDPMWAPLGDDHALLTWFISSGGFTRIVDLQDPPNSTLVAGSDFDGAWLELTNLTSGQPTARLNVPDLQHGSPHPVDAWIHAGIQDALTGIFPSVRFEGAAIRSRKNLLLVNECQEPLTVWVQDLTSESGPSAIRTVDVPAGQTVLVEVPAGVGPAGVGPAGVGPAGVGPAGVGPAGVGPAGGESGPKALEASRVRLWAESSDGELWTEWKEEDLWLVEPSPQLDGRRSYLASDVESYVHRFRPRVSQRVFAEKMLKMTNALPESIKVDLLFESRTESFWTWKRLGIFEIPGNSSMFPKSEFGLSVRASRVRFVAHSESCRFETFKDEPLWLVEDTPSGRRYRADQIGVFDFVFDPARE